MSEARQTGHEWSPITDLPEDLRQVSSQELNDLVARWRGQLDELGEHSLAEEFRQRLIREWSIETGILEGLYTLDESITLTLVEQGFDAVTVSSSDTDVTPSHLMATIGDHRRAAEGLFAFVAQKRQLDTGYIKELHASLTEHQVSCEAVDPFGRLVEVPLVRGEYKKLPNNPGDPSTGKIRHEYCPPVHVAAEMDRLVAMHLDHGEVSFEVEAAWLHHRFTQIHPFQDGNGRLARSLATLICLRAGSLPLVVSRGDKPEYISALEEADRGDLHPLVEMFRRLQKARLLKALSLTEATKTEGVEIDEIIAAAQLKVSTSQEARAASLQAVMESLREVAHDRLSDAWRKLRAAGFEPSLFECSPGKEHYFRHQIIEVANHFDYYANLAGIKSWVHLRVGLGESFHLLISLHQMGRLEDGVMVATALSFTRHVDDEDSAPHQSEVAPISDAGAFTFTADRDPIELQEAFASWIDLCIKIGLAQWQKTL